MQRKIKELQLASAGILARVMNDVLDEVEGFNSIAKSKYFLKRIAIEDQDKSPYLALSLIFLQEEETYRSTMDDEVLEAVRNSLKANNLNDRVRDVVVNLNHLRDNVLAS
jgi:hypothetical protein